MRRFEGEPDGTTQRSNRPNGLGCCPRPPCSPPCEPVAAGPAREPGGFRQPAPAARGPGGTLGILGRSLCGPAGGAARDRGRGGPGRPGPPGREHGQRRPLGRGCARGRRRWGFGAHRELGPVRHGHRHHRGIRPSRVERDRRRRGHRLVHLGLDRHADRRPRPGQLAGRPGHHPGRGQPVGLRHDRAGRHRRELAAGACPRNVALDPGNPHVLPAARRHPGPVRRAHRLQRHRRGRLRGRVPDVRAGPGRGRAGPRRRPVVHPAGTRGRRHVQLPRQAGHPGDDHAREGRELRPDAAVGRPAARLQRPGQRPGPGPAGARGRDEDLPGHHVLRLLGRPDQAEHPGRLAGPGPGPAHRDGAVLHPAGHLRLRPAGHAGGHGVDRQRDPQRHPVAGRRGQLHDRGGWDNLASCSRRASPAPRRATRPATSC